MLHVGLLGLLFLLHFVLPAYHHSIVARVMVISVYALGYNILFGYTGLLSLGHAMFFAAGMYAAGLMIKHFGWSPGPALVAGLVGGYSNLCYCWILGSKNFRGRFHDPYADVFTSILPSDRSFSEVHRR